MPSVPDFPIEIGLLQGEFLLPEYVLNNQYIPAALL